MTTRALLLAGGLGTRLRPLTDTVPKCLIEVGGRPMLDYWVDALEHAGVHDALINTHHLPEPVRAYITQINATRPVTLHEAFEPELQGSAGTLHANRNFADDADEVVVIYADNLSDIDLNAFLTFHRQHDDPVTMALFRTPYPKKCGIATLDGAGRITDFVEKPDVPDSDLANAGLYVLSRAAWREIADMDAFDFGFDVIPKFVGRMRGFEHQGYHRDIGTPESLTQAQHDIKGLAL
ncbi:nucleotidyltransferase family protein [Octadecabacter sp. 1_MG-2023]|uniref:nucleotidyltransferase family protein n=1 Tax=unclassified Octadecabacter TaxID=196158 RepID=UPI001C08AF7F|nr:MULTISPECIES: nucleotidyltransferase family protein [unclassified Octadecabacter]MBU2994061.1 nucleotidyltransferase family protein [Octadecabacter sp. B2R22]MDO6736085.1 nucleotidyltransferase family protein [Octadecabacter sp. 1_MG-2023]